MVLVKMLRIALLAGCAALFAPVTPSHAAMWVTDASPNNGNYVISWNTNPLGCTYEDIYPPYGYYVTICNTLEQSIGGGGWSAVSGSGTSVSFSGKSANTYEYRLMVSWDGGSPTQAEWMQVVVSSAPSVSTQLRTCVPSQSNACDSSSALRQDILDSGIYSAMAYGSLILSSSQTLPLSEIFTVCYANGKTVCSFMDSNALIDLENRMYAKAADIPVIEVPPEWGTSATGAEYELVEGYIVTLLPATGENGFSFYHGIIQFGGFQYFKVVDSRTGQTKTVWTGDRITLRFQNGQTVQLKFVGSAGASGHYFKWVNGSERNANGEPALGYTPTPGSATPSGPEIVLASGSPVVTDITADLVFQLCVVKIESCTNAGSSPCFTHNEVFVCQH